MKTRTSGSAMFYVDFERLGLAGTSGSAMFYVDFERLGLAETRTSGYIKLNHNLLQ